MKDNLGCSGFSIFILSACATTVIVTTFNTASCVLIVSWKLGDDFTSNDNQNNSPPQ